MLRKLCLILLCAAMLAAADNRHIILEGAEKITIEGPGAAAANRHPEFIAEILYSYQSRIANLYTDFYHEDNSIVGNITIMFTLEADGRVSGCVTLSNDTGSTELADALVEYIKGLMPMTEIAEPEYRSWVTVTVPYDFLPPDENGIKIIYQTPGLR